MGKLFEELKRRKVFRVAAVYAVVAWVLIQVTDVVLPTFGAPEWVNQTIIFLFILGFPPTLIAAWAYEITPEGVKADSATHVTQSVTNSTDRNLIYAILVLVLLVAGFQLADNLFPGVEVNTSLSTTLSNPTPSGGKVTRALIGLGNMQRLPAETLFTNFDFTPDGTRIVYSSYANGNFQLHVRNLDSLESQTIFQSDSLSAFSPRVSPNGEEIAFITASSELYKMPITGGVAPTKISDNISHASYAWLDDQNIIAAQGVFPGGTLSGFPGGTFITLRVSTEVQEPLAIEGELESGIFKNPHLLPGNKFLLYSFQEFPLAEPHTGIVDLSTHQGRALIQNAYAAIYLPTGHIAFLRGNDLWAVAFDFENKEIIGQEFLMISGVENASQQMFAVYSVSSNGQLLYVPGGDQGLNSSRDLIIIDRDGREEKLELPPQIYSDYQISPDGSQLAMSITDTDGSKDVWVYHLQRETLSKVTFSGGSQNAIWSPDGESLVFEDTFSGMGLWKIRANGLGLVEQLVATTDRAVPRAFSPDGSNLIFQYYATGTGTGTGLWDLNMLSFDNSELSQQVLLGSRFTERFAAISPDGSWLAYASDESGRFEVYVRPFPNVDDDKIQVSSGGGSEPQWSADGTELFFIDDPENALVSVPVNFDSGFGFGASTTLTSVTAARFDPPNYSVFPNGKSLLIARDGDASSSSLNAGRIVNAVIVENWLEEVKRLVPVPEQ